MGSENELLPFEIVARFHNELTSYFEEIYGPVKIIPYNDSPEYFSLIESALKDTDNFRFASYISPDGKLKRMNLDLSRFELKDFYAKKINLNIHKLNNEYAIEHPAIEYLGLSVDDLMLAGYFRIGLDCYKNQFYLQYDSTKHFPSKKVFDTIEDILINMDAIYITNGNNDHYSVFSIKSGDTIKDIIKYVNQHKI